MLDTPHGFALAVLLTLPLGCYEGYANPDVDDVAAGDSNPADDTPNDSGNDDDDAPDDSGDSQDDEPEGDPFDVPGNEARLLPFHVRMTNLSTVVGVPIDDPIFTELYDRRVLLGDHDFANGIAPDLTWHPDRMAAWVRSLKPVCSSAAFLTKFPNASEDPRLLLRTTLAREPTDEELEAYGGLRSVSSDPVVLDQLACLTALSSLEFVAH